MENEYLKAIAVELGGEFKSNNAGRFSTGHIVLPDGVRFWISTGEYGMKDRVEVSSYYPQHNTSANSMQHTIQRDFDREVPYHKSALGNITFSTSKTPAQAVRDIERRYLKEYRGLYARALEYCERQEAYYSGKRAVEQGARHHLAGVNTSQGGRVYADLGYFNNETCTVNVHGLCVADVARLAKFIREL